MQLCKGVPEVFQLAETMASLDRLTPAGRGCPTVSALLLLQLR